MLKFDVVSLADAKFKSYVKINPGGSIVLGYLNLATIVVSDALGDGVDLKFGLSDTSVRLTAAGKPRIEPNSRPYTKRDGTSGRSYDWFPASAATREALTILVFALPEVQLAVEEAERMRAAA